MIRFKPGEEPALYASGLRNTVGFDWQPGTGDLYGVDNGRDWLGDNFPPEKVNRLIEDGLLRLALPQRR
jgi:glucose/arabinose dehydrogenase